MNQPTSNISKRWLTVFFLLVGFMSPVKAYFNSGPYLIDGLYYFIDSTNNTAEVRAYKKLGDGISYVGGDLIIPSTVVIGLNTYTVTSIGYRGFEQCDRLSSVVIPNTVTNISYRAFYNCSGMTSVIIPNSVTSIGEQAFYICSSLASVVIPNSVTSIEALAFAGCHELKKCAYPSDLENPFDVENSVPYPREWYVDSAGVIYDSEKSTLYYVPLEFEGSYEIPNSVTSIGSHTFHECSGLTSVDIPNSVTSIGDNAFNGCSGLTSVDIPNSVISIGDNAFSGCSGLTSVVIPNSVISVGYHAFYPVVNLKKYAIPEGLNCSLPGERIIYSRDWYVDSDGVIYDSDKSTLYYVPLGFEGSYKIPNSVTSIGNGAFYKCEGITTVEIPNSVTSIGKYAFYYCTGLTSLVIPNSVTSLGDCATDGCSGLIKFAYPSDVGLNFAFYSRGDISYSRDCYVDNKGVIYDKDMSIIYYVPLELEGSYEIPNSVTSIGNGAFYKCEGITTVEIPNSVISIGKDAFYYCTGLTSVEMSNSVISIGDGAFYMCYRLTSIEIPNSVTLIGNEAFFRTAITSVVIPNSVNSISDGAFGSCNRLTSVDIPNSVTSIGNKAFSGCVQLTSVVIPNSVISIGDSAFSGCSGLTSVEIPNSVTSIGKSAFNWCPALTSVEIPNSVATIGYGAFSNCFGISSVVIPNSVISIGANAFFSCAGLKKCAYPNTINNPFYSGVLAIPYESDCFIDSNGVIFNRDKTSLYFAPINIKGSYDIPNTVTSLGNSAFAHCSELISIEVPHSVNYISEYAFMGCSSLKKVTLGRNVSSIGTDAFCGCTGVMELYLSSSEPPGCGAGAIWDINKQKCILFVPNGSLDAYKTAFRWEDFMTIETKVLTDNIQLNAEIIHGKPGETVQLIAEIQPDNASDQDLVWTSSDPSIASVDANGLVTFKNVGVATICVRSTDGSDVEKSIDVCVYSTFEWNQEFRCTPGDKVELLASADADVLLCYNSIVPDGGFQCADITQEDGKWFAYFPTEGSYILECSIVGVPDSKITKKLNVVYNPDELLYIDGIYYRYEDDSKTSLKVVRGFEVYRGDYTIPSQVNGIAVKSIDNLAFYSCKNLRNVVICEGVETIGNQSFGNSSIQSIHIPNSIIQIDLFAFNALSRDIDGLFTLKHIWLHAGVPIEVSEYIFNGYTNYERCVLHVPEGRIDAYRNARVWGDFDNIVDDIIVFVPVEEIRIVCETATLKKGRTLELSAEVLPDTATNSNVVWSSSDDSIASVDADGVVTALTAGNVEIVATAEDGSGVSKTFALTVIPPIKGDSNDNDVVTISDAVNTANYAVGNEVRNFNFEAADVNEDNRITLSDASATVAIVLDQPVQAPSMAKVRALASAANENSDLLVIDDYSAKPGETASVSVALDNTIDYVALQADVIVPEDITLAAVNIGNRAEASHSIAVRRIDDRTIRVALFNPGNSAFADNDKAILELVVKVNGTTADRIEINNILASDAQAHEYVLTSTGGNYADMSGVDNANYSDIRIETGAESINIYNAEGREVAICTVDGTTVTRFIASSGFESRKVVPGIYVVAAGNKVAKVIVK